MPFIPRILTKVSPKKIIQYLLILVVFTWVLGYLYLLSNKSAGLFADYANELANEEGRLIKSIEGEKPYAENLMLIYKELCQIKLCENDYKQAQKCIDSIFNISKVHPKHYQEIDLNLFAANIYRNFRQFELAQIAYQSALNLIKATPDQKAQNIQADQAKILNNQGTNFFMQAQNAANKRECRLKYLAAKNCFEQGKDLLQEKNICLKQTIESNLNQCLIELQFLD